MEDLNVQIKKANDLFESGKFFEASFSYKEILYRTTGKKISKENQHLIKNKLKESILKAKDEYRELHTEMELSEEMIGQVYKINSDIIRKVDKNLHNLLPLTFSTIFICSSEDNESSAKKTLPLSYQITNFSIHTKQGYLLANNDDYTPIELWSFKMYEIGQSIKKDFHINPILKTLTETGVFSLENFSSLLKDKGLEIPENDLDILKYGVSIYLANDFTSALHILVPQFENLLIIVSEKAGIQTTAFERGKTITKRITISDFNLKSDEMTAIFGKDYCYYLRYVLYSPLGLSIRHKIAHGTISQEECTLGNCNLVLLAIFILLNKIQHKG